MSPKMDGNPRFFCGVRCNGCRLTTCFCCASVLLCSSPVRPLVLRSRPAGRTGERGGGSNGGLGDVAEQKHKEEIFTDEKSAGFASDEITLHSGELYAALERSGKAGGGEGSGDGSVEEGDSGAGGGDQNCDEAMDESLYDYSEGAAASAATLEVDAAIDMAEDKEDDLGSAGMGGRRRGGWWEPGCGWWWWWWWW